MAEQRPTLPMLVQFHEGIIVTVDSTAGLRAWQTKGDHKLIAMTSLPSNEIEGSGSPTSLAIDTVGSKPEELRIAIGLMHGRFSIYQLLKNDRKFTHLCTHSTSTNSITSAIAYASPYILTMAKTRLLSFYRFEPEEETKNEKPLENLPCLLSSLYSQTTHTPLSLAIRISATGIFASIAYSVPTYLVGWGVGMQELHLTLDGNILESRLTTALSSPATRPRLHRLGRVGFGYPLSKPTSLSYTHPYLLSTHPDNTLMLYMVTSNADYLTIEIGDRLWGHTSSISGAHVGDRGKVVSMSTHGSELRIWELEGGVSSNASKRRMVTGEASVQVQPGESLPEKSVLKNGTSTNLKHPDVGLINSLSTNETAITNLWVGFDDQKIVVLREKKQGNQTLVLYDFTLEA